MALVKPNRASVADDGKFLDILANFYESLVELFRDQLPSTVPGLKCVTSPTHAEARQHVGDYAGQLGPRAMIVAGRTAPLDGGEGIFVWDATSTLADDDTNTMQPNAVLFGKPGRWRKGSF